MAGAERLYTAELLALAVELGQWPPLETADVRSEARSPTCGSTLALDLALDGAGRIAQLGLRARACAVGQASAAIFARHAIGLRQGDIAATFDALEAWLANAGPMPDWPDLAVIAAARDFPSRHGAMLLPWKAAVTALSTPAAAG